MRRLVFCRVLPAARLAKLLREFPPFPGGEAAPCCVRQLADGSLLLDRTGDIRQLVFLERDAGGARLKERLFHESGDLSAGRSVDFRLFGVELFRRISGEFERRGRFGAAAAELSDFAPVPGAFFRGFLSVPPLSGRSLSAAVDASRSASLLIGDEECWFDVANHIEPFCLSYAAPAGDALDPYDRSRGALRGEYLGYRAGRTFFYPLGDGEMLTGWAGLAEAAGRAGKAAGGKAGVVLDSGCLAQVCGVDTRGVADGLRAAGAAFVTLTTPVSRAEQPFLPGDRAKKRGAGRPRSVDFFNAGDDGFRAELRALCAAAGLSVNSFCLPEYSRALAPSYGRGAVAVVFSSARNAGAVRSVLGGVAPLLGDECFGPAQMSRLAARLAAAAGVRAARALPADLLCPGAAARLAAVRRAFRGLRAAVVLEAGELHQALGCRDPRLRADITAASFLSGADMAEAPLETSARLRALREDAGLGLDFFLLARRPPLPGIRAAMFRALRAAFPGSSARIFGTEDALYAALGSGRQRGVFSGYRFDDRALERGRMPLDLELVGQGVSGALAGYEILARKLSAGLFG
ncbi:MAG: hypothetical protein M0025_02150 [Elusimicrobia bacterium]|nr:hypothetical protein [Elusimicrobiota bacterium]